MNKTIFRGQQDQCKDVFTDPEQQDQCKDVCTDPELTSWFEKLISDDKVWSAPSQTKS